MEKRVLTTQNTKCGIQNTEYRKHNTEKHRKTEYRIHNNTGYRI
jgi:hypothetical protein